MKKYLNISLIALSLFLNACSAVETTEGFIPVQDVKPLLKDVIIQEQEEVSSIEEEREFEKAKMEELLENIAAIPPYKELDKRVKKVEIKKVVVKPVFNQSNGLHLLTDEGAESFLENIKYESDLIEGKNYDDKNIIAMMDNYKVLLQTSATCCIANITYDLKSKGIEGDGLVRFLATDADDYDIQDTCLIVSNNDINDIFGKGEVAKTIKKSRKNCICNNKETLRKNINNFYKLYNKDPDFYKQVLVYKYKDKQGRVVEHNINESVLNIAVTLENCP